MARNEEIRSLVEQIRVEKEKLAKLVIVLNKAISDRDIELCELDPNRKPRKTIDGKSEIQQPRCPDR